MYQSSGNKISFRRQTKVVMGDRRHISATTEKNKRQNFYLLLSQHLQCPGMPLLPGTKDEKNEYKSDFIAFPLDAEQEFVSPIEAETVDFTEKSANYSQRLFSNPKDVDLWLEFIEFQNTLSSVGMKSKSIHTHILEKQAYRPLTN